MAETHTEQPTSGPDPDKPPEPAKAPAAKDSQKKAASPKKTRPAAPKSLPQGETPEAAIQRIAPTPVSFVLHLSGTGDDGDSDALLEAFRRFVRKVRASGLSVTGQLTGNAAPVRTGDTVSEGVVIHELAGDVE